MRGVVLCVIGPPDNLVMAFGMASGDFVDHLTCAHAPDDLSAARL